MKEEYFFRQTPCIPGKKILLLYEQIDEYEDKNIK